MVNIGNKTEPLHTYESPNTIIVLPITQFIRKDGGVVVVHNYSKETMSRYPHMSKQWGYLVSQGVFSPSSRSDTYNYIGLPDRTHYAAAVNEDLVSASLTYIGDLAEALRLSYIYLPLDFGWEPERLVAYLDGVPNVVLLREVEEYENVQEVWQGVPLPEEEGSPTEQVPGVPWSEGNSGNTPPEDTQGEEPS